MIAHNPIIKTLAFTFGLALLLVTSPSLANPDCNDISRSSRPLDCIASSVIYAGGSRLFDDGTLWTVNHEFGKWAGGLDEVFSIHKFSYKNLEWNGMESLTDKGIRDFHDKIAAHGNHFFTLGEYTDLNTDKNQKIEPTFILRKYKDTQYLSSELIQGVPLEELSGHTITGMVVNEQGIIFISSALKNAYYITRVYIGKDVNEIKGPIQIDDRLRREKWLNGLSVNSADSGYALAITGQYREDDGTIVIVLFLVNDYSLKFLDIDIIKTGFKTVVLQPAFNRTLDAYVAGSSDINLDEDPYCRSGELSVKKFLGKTGALLFENNVPREKFECLSGIYSDNDDKLFLSGRNDSSGILRKYDGLTGKEIMFRNLF